MGQAMPTFPEYLTSPLYAGLNLLGVGSLPQGIHNVLGVWDLPSVLIGKVV